MNIQIPPEVQSLLDQKAPVILGVSGGKDSLAAAIALAEYLHDYEGPKLLLHADLLEVEWLDSWAACQRMSAALGWELASCTRPAGGMMARWESRWESSRRRYEALETVTVVLPWSTPSMRFCSSELKVDPISAYIKRRFGAKTLVLNATGVRAEESAARAKQPVCSAAAKLPAGSISWRPIHHWTPEDVWAAIKDSGIEPHEAYTKYGSTRVSCRFCILSSEADLRASLKDPAAQEIYRRMCDLELTSGFAFQGNRWLSSLAPDLVPGADLGLMMALHLAASRTAAQAWLPKHLLFKKGWPEVMPTAEEAEKLAEMRRTVCGLYQWESPYLTAESVLARYEELMAQKLAKAV